MAAGDVTTGFIANVDKLDASLTAASVTLAGKPGELNLISVGMSIQWVYVEQV